jgi:hypothetical protein
MNEASRNEISDLEASLSRRRLFIKAGLMSIGALGASGFVNALRPDGWAEGSQKLVHRVAQRRRTRTELLTILQSHPGGPQAIEAARRRGANVALVATPTQPPQVQGNPPVTPFSFSLVLVPGQLQVGNSLAVFGRVTILADSSIMLIGEEKSGAKFQIDFPKNGWYLLNIEGLQVSSYNILAQLVEQSGPNPSLQIQTWSYPSVPGANTQNPIPRSFPALVEYTGKKKDVYLKLTQGEISFLQLSAEAL